MGENNFQGKTKLIWEKLKGQRENYNEKLQIF